MSRYIIQIDENKEIAYGFDHAVGYFYDIFLKTKRKDEIDDNPIDGGTSLFGRDNKPFTKSDMVEVMEKYNVPNEHITQVALDLPF
jgi:hypothetical protein